MVEMEKLVSLQKEGFIFPSDIYGGLACLITGLWG